jgi:hypothetical protein
MRYQHLVMKLKVYLVGLIFAIMVPMLVFSAVTAFLFHSAA